VPLLTPPARRLLTSAGALALLNSGARRAPLSPPRSRPAQQVRVICLLLPPRALLSRSSPLELSSLRSRADVQNRRRVNASVGCHYFRAFLAERFRFEHPSQHQCRCSRLPPGAF
jgi:hypothetical protein